MPKPSQKAGNTNPEYGISFDDIYKNAIKLSRPLERAAETQKLVPIAEAITNYIRAGHKRTPLSVKIGEHEIEVDWGHMLRLLQREKGAGKTRFKETGEDTKADLTYTFSSFYDVIGHIVLILY